MDDEHCILELTASQLKQFHDFLGEHEHDQGITLAEARNLGAGYVELALLDDRGEQYAQRVLSPT